MYKTINTVIKNKSSYEWKKILCEDTTGIKFLKNIIIDLENIEYDDFDNYLQDKKRLESIIQMIQVMRLSGMTFILSLFSHIVIFTIDNYGVMDNILDIYIPIITSLLFRYNITDNIIQCDKNNIIEEVNFQKCPYTDLEVFLSYIEQENLIKHTNSEIILPINKTLIPFISNFLQYNINKSVKNNK